MARMPNFKANIRLKTWNLLKPFITPTNILLLAIFILIFLGLYYSSPLFEFKVDSLGLSYKSEHIGDADLICKKIVGVELSDKDSKRLQDLSNKFTWELSPEELDERWNLRNETKKEVKIDNSIGVIRNRKYKFGFTVSEDYSYATEFNSDCECKLGLDRTKVCKYKAYDKPIPM